MNINAQIYTYTCQLAYSVYVPLAWSRSVLKVTEQAKFLGLIHIFLKGRAVGVISLVEVPPQRVGLNQNNFLVEIFFTGSRLIIHPESRSCSTKLLFIKAH